MTNTALRAENSNSRTITFKSKEHEKFYMEYLKKCRYQDVYHQALVYCLGIDRDTRENVNKIYNFIKFILLKSDQSFVLVSLNSSYLRL